MRIDNEVTSFELSQKMRDLGVSQKSFFVWKSRGMVIFDPYENHLKHDLAAFTPARLFQLMPLFIDTKINFPFNQFRFGLKRSIISDDGENFVSCFVPDYFCDTWEVKDGEPMISTRLCSPPIYDIKLADSLAKLFIYLIENGYIKYDTTI